MFAILRLCGFLCPCLCVFAILCLPNGVSVRVEHTHCCSTLWAKLFGHCLGLAHKMADKTNIGQLNLHYETHFSLRLPLLNLSSVCQAQIIYQDHQKMCMPHQWQAQPLVWLGQHQPTVRTSLRAQQPTWRLAMNWQPVRLWLLQVMLLRQRQRRHRIPQVCPMLVIISILLFNTAKSIT